MPWRTMLFREDTYAIETLVLRVLGSDVGYQAACSQ